MDGVSRSSYFNCFKVFFPSFFKSFLVILFDSIIVVSIIGDQIVENAVLESWASSENIQSFRY